MKWIVTACIAALILASCGADGEPTAPTVTGQTSIGYNSINGTYTSTSIGIEIGG